MEYRRKHILDHPTLLWVFHIQRLINNQRTNKKCGHLKAIGTHCSRPNGAIKPPHALSQAPNWLKVSGIQSIIQPHMGT